MLIMRKGYADGPHGQVHYQVAGDGPTLLLCHQSPCNLRMFRAAYPLLAGHGIRAIGIDTPGYGQSDPVPGAPTIAAFAKAVASVMDHLGLAEAAILGHHTGASIAAELAVREPERIRRVILNGPPLFTPEERREYQAALAQAERVVPREDGQHLLAAWERRKHFTPGWTSLEAMHAGVVMMLTAGAHEWDGYTAAFAHDIAGPLARIRQPTLILTNTGDDLYACSCRAREARPDFAFTALPGGTHDIVDEQPAAWSDAVARFVLADPT